MSLCYSLFFCPNHRKTFHISYKNFATFQSSFCQHPISLRSQLLVIIPRKLIFYQDWKFSWKLSDQFIHINPVYRGLFGSWKNVKKKQSTIEDNFSLINDSEISNKNTKAKHGKLSFVWLHQPP